MRNIFTIIVKVIAKAGYENVLAEEQMKLVEISRKSPGCIRYDLHRSNEDQGLLYFVEEWESRELWQIHIKSNYIHEYGQATAGFVESAELHEMHLVLGHVV